MADRIRFAFSVMPIETVKRAIAYTQVEQADVLDDVSATDYDVNATEIGKNFGGSGVCLITDYGNSAEAQGYVNRTPNYKEAYAIAVGVSTETAAKFLMIKNTGKTYSTPSVLGSDSDNSIKVIAGGVTLGILASGEGMIFKDANGGINATLITVQAVDADGSAPSGDTAVEFLAVK